MKKIPMRMLNLKRATVPIHHSYWQRSQINAQETMCKKTSLQ